MPTRRLALLLGPVLAAAAAGLVPAAPGEAAAAARRPGPAYWMVSEDGGVYAFGRGRFAGAMTNLPPALAVVAVAATPTGDGYWLAGRDGGVFAFGDAGFAGGLAGTALNAPVVDIAATSTGGGYWLAAADGGVFAFGDATWLGGLAGSALNAPVTAIAPTPSGQGYWLTAADGGVFAYGDASWLGGATADPVPLRSAVVDLAATPSGLGYWLVAADGEVRPYGEASALVPAHEGARGGAPTVGIATTPSGHGYWVVDAAGNVYGFGDAGGYGSLTGAAPPGRVVGVTAGLGRAVPPPPPKALDDGEFGWDISWPQCGGIFPPVAHRYAIIGVTDGHAFSVNPCLAEQHRWSYDHGSLGGLYVNVNYPPPRLDGAGLAAQMAHRCLPQDLGCQLRAWGEEGAVAAVEAAEAQGVASPMWWMDIETTNRWSQDPATNALVIAGAIDALRDHGLKVGIYSTPYQWGLIAGTYSPGLPTWVAGPRDAAGAAAACHRGVTFGGGEVWMVQFPHQGFDGNVMCRAGALNAARSFRLPAVAEVPEIAAVDGRAY